MPPRVGFSRVTGVNLDTVTPVAPKQPTRMTITDAVEINGENSLTSKKQTTKFSPPNFQKMLHVSPSNSILRIQRLEGKQCISR